MYTGGTLRTHASPSSSSYGEHNLWFGGHTARSERVIYANFTAPNPHTHTHTYPHEVDDDNDDDDDGDIGGDDEHADSALSRPYNTHTPV